MQIKVYRGTHRIGGCVIGIFAGKNRILIDMGKSLADTKGKMPDDKLIIGDSYDAVIFTHYHKDHIGLMEYIAPKVPLYIGEEAREIYLQAKSTESEPSLLKRIETMHTYKDGVSFQVGDIRITPILTDHSAFDAYMLLIEGEGKAILHTGDFRLHGIKGDSVLPKLSQYRRKIDVMITEGTNLSYKNPITCPEEDLGRAAEILMERFAYTFVLCGQTDFDRIAVFHKAAEKKEKFFCDLHQMKLLENIKEESKEAFPLYGFERAEIYLQQPAEIPESFCMMVRKEKAFQEIVKPYTEKYPEKSLMIYAVPEGYLKKHKSAIEKIFGGFPYQIKLHTSGHASEEAIWAAAQTVQPKKVIPIHTENPEKIRLGSLQNRVVFLEDGDSYDIL